ncbi:MAG: helix-turn-helix domain-containing protein [Propionibacteriaceae bacterium]|jgi:transcriptional regulator GlxA family with amidase domain|nr:helix-turn-helix domain-containing protein [Propionibacteriaceae bacterium]
MIVGLLLADAMRSFDVGAALEVFAYDRTVSGVPRDDVRLASPAGQVTLDHGLRLATGPLSGLAGCELIVVPGFANLDAYPSTVTPASPYAGQRRPGWADLAVPPGLAAALVEAHAAGAEIASVCTGAFVLAQAGLLDGAEATTHWGACQTLAEQHPRVRVRPDVLYTHDAARRVWTSAGVTAGIDLCIAIKAHHHGAVAAATVARSMVLPAVRHGGQAQYIPPRLAERETVGADLAALCAAVRRDLGRAWTLADMAAAGHLSSRSLQRRFAAQIGLSPSAWLIRERVRAAQELLESSVLDVGQVASRVGFGSADLLRKHFRPLVGTTPTRYRTAFPPPRPAGRP